MLCMVLNCNSASIKTNDELAKPSQPIAIPYLTHICVDIRDIRILPCFRIYMVDEVCAALNCGVGRAVASTELAKSL